MSESPKKIALVTGGTGFIGKLLCRELLKEGYVLWLYSRQKPSLTQAAQEQRVHCFRSLSALPDTDNPDLIINLAGEPIADSRWTAARKKLLLDSRVGVTEELVRVFSEREVPAVVISGSAVGFYGSQSNEVLVETSAFADSFSHDLCAAWEAEAEKFTAMGSRVCLLRTGIVLDSGGGTLARLLPLFKLGLGGPMGNGEQWMSWIHREDLVRLILFLIAHSDISGPVNGTAPNPVTNRVFANTLGQVLHRPTFIPTPGFVLRLLFGQMAEELLLGGQNVVPQKALQHDFRFNYSRLEDALESCVA